LSFQSLLSLLLVGALFSETLTAAQTPAAPQTPPAPAPAKTTPPPAPAKTTPAPTVEALKVFVLDGEGAVNNIRAGLAVAPVVEVRDENDRPLEGAEVLFQLPPSGPGGYFAGRQLSYTAKTNYQGQATVAAYVPNDRTGRFRIEVTARAGNRLGRARITQTNSTEQYAAEQVRKKGRGKVVWILVGLLAAGGAGAGYYWTNRGDKTLPPGPREISLAPGTVTIGGPR